MSRLLSGPPDRLAAPLVCHPAEQGKKAQWIPLRFPSGICGMLMSRPDTDSTDNMHETESLLSDIFLIEMMEFQGYILLFRFDVN